jgi:hypothetical protein
LEINNREFYAFAGEKKERTSSMRLVFLNTTAGQLCKLIYSPSLNI